MGLCVLVYASFMVMLFLNAAHASVLNGEPQKMRPHAFSVDKDGLKDRAQSHRSRTGYDRREFDTDKVWFHKIAEPVKDSALERTNSYPQEATASARNLVADVDYVGDYHAGANNNPLTSSSPPAPPGLRKRRLLQDYDSVANRNNFVRPRGRKLLVDYAEPAPNPSVIH